MAMASLKRLKREISTINKAEVQDPEIFLLPSENNIREWTASIKGPPDSPYENRFFSMKISIGSEYPLSPPTIIFISKVFHPNVNFNTGEICLDILKREWTPAWSVETACRAIIALLGAPDIDSPWNCDAGNMLRCGDVIAFNSTARLYAIEHGMLSFPK
mmetsp:Transcript_41073/g.52971  ORF Transcript_41073/g.52971 Transcript_41073/m.52971 type:complete len:160 (-) Transcript_41073:157-636(-)